MFSTEIRLLKAKGQADMRSPDSNAPDTDRARRVGPAECFVVFQLVGACVNITRICHH